MLSLQRQKKDIYVYHNFRRKKTRFHRNNFAFIVN